MNSRLTASPAHVGGLQVILFLSGFILSAGGCPSAETAMAKASGRQVR